jgi:hypothetical protein
MKNLKFIVFFFLLSLNFNNELYSEDAALPGDPLKYLYFDIYPEFYKNSLEYENRIISKKNEDRYLSLFSTNKVKFINLKIKNGSVIKSKSNVFKINQNNKYKKTVNILKHNLLFNENFNKSILQIEYFVTKNSKIKMMIFGFPNDSINNCFYIKWSSKNVDDFIKPCSRRGLFSPTFMWGINKSTESITSNLDSETIKQLFPDFEGLYYLENFKEIIIDYKYNIENLDFYWNIEFNK